MWHRFVGDHFGPVRLLVLPCAVLDVVVLAEDPTSPGVWFFALASAVVSLTAGLLPLPTLIVQTVLLVAADAALGHPPVTTVVMTSVALLEVTVRRWGVPTVLGAGLLIAVYLGNSLIAVDPLTVFYRTIWSVLAPVLAGAYLRKLRETARLAQQRAFDAEARRDLAEQGARLAERTAIARELHDVVAHHVASITLRVGVARHVLSDVDSRVAEVLDDVHTTAAAALADLRRLVRALRDPDTADADLVSLLVDPTELPTVLQSLVERSEAAGLTVTAQIDPGVATLDAVRGLVVLRLAQEGLTNVVKHGGIGASATLRVCLASSDRAEVEVHNRGDLPDRQAERGFGLIGLTERLESVGGALTVGPVRDGWRLLGTVPVAGPAT